MASRDKVSELLVDLADPAERRTRRDLMERAMHTLMALMDADGASILVPSGTRAERLVLHAGGLAPAVLPLAPDGSEALRRLPATGQPLLLDLMDEALVAEVDGCPGVEPGPAMFAPVRQRDRTPAYLAVFRRRGRARFNHNDTRQMLLLTAWLGTALDHQRLATGTQRLVVTDDLTGVYNYRFLKAALRREMRRASRFAHEMSVVMVEVDRLEAYAEEHGALRGTLLIKEVASMLAPLVRAFDVLGTYRRNGFLLILPQTDHAAAVEVAERLRAAAEQHPFSGAAPGDVTLSLGVGTFPRDAGDVADLLAATDRALRQAKAYGANRVQPVRRAA